MAYSVSPGALAALSGQSGQQPAAAPAGSDYVETHGRVASEDPTPAPAPDSAESSPEAAELDRAYPVAKATDFDTSSLLEPGETPTAETKAFATSLTGYLIEAGATKEGGNAMLKEGMRVAQQHRNMNAVDRDVYHQTEKAKLQRLWGDQYDARLKVASDLIWKLDRKSPGLGVLLGDSGVGNSAMFVTQVFFAAERANARKK